MRRCYAISCIYNAERDVFRAIYLHFLIFQILRASKKEKKVLIESEWAPVTISSEEIAARNDSINTSRSSIADFDWSINDRVVKLMRKGLAHFGERMENVRPLFRSLSIIAIATASVDHDWQCTFLLTVRCGHSSILLRNHVT